MEQGNFFVNAPDIAKKIEKRAEGYTAKDIVAIVEEYNSLQKSGAKPALQSLLIDAQ